MDFKNFRDKVNSQFKKLAEAQLLTTYVDPDILYNLYLDSFPEGTNEIYRERREYDCNTCRQFIKRVGSVIAIINGKIETVWDVDVSDGFKQVAEALSNHIKQSVYSAGIKSEFTTTEANAGINQSFEYDEAGFIPEIENTWNHLYTVIPKKYVFSGVDIGPRSSVFNGKTNVFIRSLKELTLDSVDTVIELINQKSIIRGEEKLNVVSSFRNLKVQYDALENDLEKNIFIWTNVFKVHPNVLNMKNDVIGTLMQAVSEGEDLTEAVNSYNAKVDPTNYRRTTSVVTTGMYSSLKDTLEKEGLMSALYRRHATYNDLNINNILFTNNEVGQKLEDKDVFDTLMSETPKKVKNFDKIEEVTIDDFISKILPKAKSLEVLFEPRLSPNLVSLITSKDEEASKLFKWNNDFSLSYNGNLADANIRQKVKDAGGSVEGVFRSSLSWFNIDDLDLSIIEPDHFKIYYGNKGTLSRCGGKLDVDMNAGFGQSTTPVENIVYKDKSKMIKGNYEVYVTQYNKRVMKDVGFVLELEVDGNIHTFEHTQDLKTSVHVATVKYDGTSFEVIPKLPSSSSTNSKKVWNVNTNTFVKVSSVMMSPNFWEENPTGNKHYLFMLEDCKNEDGARGFYNEFLKDTLVKHRKALEVVSSRIPVEKVDKELSGLGFSSTLKNSATVKVTGSFNRIIKILF